MGKIQYEQLIGYKCEEMVIQFGNLQIYNDYPTQNINCGSNGNYLGKTLIIVLLNMYSLNSDSAGIL